MPQRSTDGDELGTKRDSFLNWETILWANRWDPSTGSADLQGEIRNNSEHWTNPDIELPDQHVLAILGFWTHFSDPVEDTDATNEADLFVYNSEITEGINGYGSRVKRDDHIYGCTIQQNGTAGMAEVSGPMYVDFARPILNADGNLSVLHVGDSGASDHGELNVEMNYDIIPVDSTEKYLELLLKR